MHPEPEPEQHRLAEWWPRVGATLLDLLITWVILLLAVVPAAIAEESIAGSDGLGGGLWLLIALILSSAYYCGTMARKGVHNGQTWGKQAAGIRVMRDDGKPMTLSLAFVREVLLKYVVGSAVLGLGWLVDSLWPLGERENRTLHDLAVRSHVVQTKPARVALPAPPPVQEHLAPEIARHVRAAHAIEAAIRDAVQRD